MYQLPMVQKLLNLRFGHPRCLCNFLCCCLFQHNWTIVFKQPHVQNITKRNSVHFFPNHRLHQSPMFYRQEYTNFFLRFPYSSRQALLPF